MSKGVPIHRHTSVSKSEFCLRTAAEQARARESDREDCALYVSCLNELARKPRAKQTCLGCSGCGRYQPAARVLETRRGDYHHG